MSKIFFKSLVLLSFPRALIYLGSVIFLVITLQGFFFYITPNSEDFYQTTNTMTKL